MRCISSPSAVFSHERHKLDGRNATNWTGEAARDATKWTVMACTHSTTWTGKAPPVSYTHLTLPTIYSV